MDGPANAGIIHATHAQRHELADAGHAVLVTRAVRSQERPAEEPQGAMHAPLGGRRFFLGTAGAKTPWDEES